MAALPTEVYLMAGSTGHPGFGIVPKSVLKIAKRFLAVVTASHNLESLGCSTGEAINVRLGPCESISLTVDYVVWVFAGPVDQLPLPFPDRVRTPRC